MDDVGKDAKTKLKITFVAPDECCYLLMLPCQLQYDDMSVLCSQLVYSAPHEAPQKNELLQI